MHLKFSRALRRSGRVRLMLVVVGLVVVAVSAANSQAITILGGAQTLNVTTAVAGADPTPVINTSSRLRYRAQAKVCRITVQTSCPSQKFTLTVLATGVVRGVAAPAVTLQNGVAATNFITSIPTGWSGTTTITLRYTASPLFSQGTGTDTHTVTYTILAP
jgi:hypothetical protein